MNMLESIILNVVCLCTINATFMVVGTFLNTVVIIGLWKSSQLRKKLRYFIIFALSCIDLAVIVITHSAQILSTISVFFGQINETWEVIRINMASILHGSSMHALFVLNVERFIALSYPFFHRKSVTKRRLIFLFIILMVLLSCVLALSNLLDLKTLANLVTTVYLLSFLLLFTYLNYKTFIIAKSKRDNDRIASYNDQERKTLKLHFKDISTCLLAVICFFVCSSPQMIYSTLRLTSKTPFHDSRVIIFHLWSCTFVSMNSTFNCLIFFWRNSILRREGIKIISCIQSTRS